MHKLKNKHSCWSSYDVWTVQASHCPVRIPQHSQRPSPPFCMVSLDFRLVRHMLPPDVIMSCIRDCTVHMCSRTDIT